MVDTVICTPAWDRGWCLDLWMSSVRANLDLSSTGLAIVCPSGDLATRKTISEIADEFAWVEVMRDRGEQMARESRHETRNAALAAARNQALAVAIKARPRWVMAWDTDLLLPPGGVDGLKRSPAPYAAAWAWLNRQPPRRIKYMSSSEGLGFQEVLWEPPACFTAMKWSKIGQRPQHYASREFLSRQGLSWRCAVATGAVLMTEAAWRRAKYAPHHDGAHVPFCLDLDRAGVERRCEGSVVGVHLYDQRAKDEIGLGWPGVMDLAEKAPIACAPHPKRSAEFEALGFYHVDDDRKSAA